MKLKNLFHNTYILPCAIVFTYFCLLLETIKYPGFVGNHFFIDAKIYIAITVTLLIFTSLKSKLLDIVLKINALILVLSSIIFITFSFIEGSHYQNYVFSTYHFHLDGLIYIFLFSTLIFLVGKSTLNVNKLSQIKNLRYLFIFFLIVYVLVTNIASLVQKAIKDDLYIATHITYTYADKMRESYGIYYDYIEFVKVNTPENSIILVPPQGYPWYLTGNTGFDRYFLYPRNLINGDEKNPKVDIGEVNYILITYGESSRSEYGFTNVWPKFNVDGEYIIYWNPLDGSTKRAEYGKYIYKPGSVEEWGIIKVNKL